MSFIIVKYGSNEERLCNPNCLSIVLLSHIKKSCGFESLLENVDLATESGEVLDLTSKPKEYAKKFVEARGTYILVKVVGDDVDEASPSFTSLLDSAINVKFSIANPSSRNRVKSKAVKSETTVKPDLKSKTVKSDNATTKPDDSSKLQKPSNISIIPSTSGSTDELKKAGSATTSKPKKN